MNTKTTSQEFKDRFKGAGYNLYIDDPVLETAPESSEGAIEYFSIGKYVSASKLSEEYESRGLIPASPYDIPTDQEHEFVATQWTDSSGKFCFATFGRWRGGRSVGVGRDDGDWHDNWWFAGLRKVSALNPSPLPSDAGDLELPKHIVGMNDELAKKLKDAGFRMWETSAVVGNTFEDGEHYWIYPTLSELIEACGEDFVGLIKRHDWLTIGHDEHTNGTTPEEAVANLWLALNQK